MSEKEKLNSPRLKILEKNLEKIEKAENYLGKELKKLKANKEIIRGKIKKEKEILRLKRRIDLMRDKKN